MLEIIGELVVALVLIALVSLVLEMLVPSENYRRYVRMVVGLVILLMVINAFSVLFRGERVSPHFLGNIPASTEGQQDFIVEEGTRLWELNQQQVINQYESVVKDYLREEINQWEDWNLIDLELKVKETASLPHGGESLADDITHKGKIDFFNGVTVFISSGGGAVEPEKAESGIGRKIDDIEIDSINVEKSEIISVQAGSNREVDSSGDGQSYGQNEKNGPQTETSQGRTEDNLSAAGGGEEEEVGLKLIQLQERVARALQLPTAKVEVVIVGHE